MHMCSASITTSRRAVQVLLQRLHHLRGQTLLHLRATSVPGPPRGRACSGRSPYRRAWNVTHMRHRGTAPGGARRSIERDVLHQHHLRVGNIEGRAQNLAGILVQTEKNSRRHAPLRRVCCRPSRSGSSPIASRISRTAALNTRLVTGVLNLAHSLLHSGSGCRSPGAAPEGQDSSGYCWVGIATVGSASGRREGHLRRQRLRRCYRNLLRGCSRCYRNSRCRSRSCRDAAAGASSAFCAS